MTDQIPAGLTLEEAQAVREWAERARSAEVQDETVLHAARVLLAVLPERPTLADMTEEERAACQWMQCDAGPAGRRGLITETADWAVHVVDKETGEHSDYSPDLVTPRPDLPRFTWPGTEKPAPAAPALPEGWRLADHEGYGRVIVTSTAPDGGGYVYFVFPFDGDFTGHTWHLCDRDELTYLDTPDAAPESTLAVGSVWDDVDALTQACEETGRDQITVTDRDGDVSVWDAGAEWWATGAPDYGFAPYTIIHAGKKADQ